MSETISQDIGRNFPDRMQAEIADKVMQAFDQVMSERSNYYRENPNSVPHPSSVQTIISSYSNSNMAVSGGMSLIPGPLGMIAVVPEIAIIIRNQLAMIYDIGMAYGKQDVLNRELLAGILLSSMGAGAGGLLVMHGSKVLVRRASLRVFQKIVVLLAGKVTQRVLKSLISKWFPVLGAVAMGAWSNYSTRMVGKRAVEIVSKSIEVVDSSDESVEAEIVYAATHQTDNDTTIDYDFLKIKALINLMHIDNKLQPTEREFIEQLIETSELNDAVKIELANLIDSTTNLMVDFTLFAAQPEESVGLLLDMVTLARRDGEINLAEKIYIKQAGKLMNISENDVEVALASSIA